MNTYRMIKEDAESVMGFLGSCAVDAARIVGVVGGYFAAGALILGGFWLLLILVLL